ncbi:MAG: rod shape-determining protein RodA [Chitinophagales bacterium]|nr:rod shape-determining protein RodA [Chitinophagales bacterium]MCZ2394746.1 rod shape-determining protein RodA [Chitinophagales bacterium]
MGKGQYSQNQLDSTIVIVYLLLIAIGWSAIFATQYDGTFSLFDLSSNHGKQLLWIGVSGLIFFIILGIDRLFLMNISYLVYGLILLLLLSVFVIGAATKGNLNWIDLGFFKLQPSEFAKLATAMALARYLDTPQVRFNTWKQRAVAFALVGVPLLIVLAQGDAGSALVFFSFVMVFNREGLSNWFIYLGIYIVFISLLALSLDKFLLIGGIVVLFSIILTYIYVVLPRERTVVALIVGIMLVSIGYIIAVDTAFHSILKPHQQDRINIILGKLEDNKGVGYNLAQSKIAIGSGGPFGKGWLHGTQTRYDFVPEMSTDFIFCSIGEEWGFLGSLVLISLFVILIQRLITVAMRQRTVYARVYIYSIASIIFMHFMINIGMTIGLLPVIGIPLPFISYGGSSLLSFTIMVAIAVKLDSERLVTA